MHPSTTANSTLAEAPRLISVIRDGMLASNLVNALGELSTSPDRPEGAAFAVGRLPRNVIWRICDDDPGPIRVCIGGRRYCLDYG